METITLENDITTCCVAAVSFPGGVMDAHNKIHALIPANETRKYFGISRPNKGQIAYWAAAELNKNEIGTVNCDISIVLKKGKYIAATIKDFMSDLSAIGNTFQQMLANPDIDPNGYCVEWYFNDKDIRCMVRLAD